MPLKCSTVPEHITVVLRLIRSPRQLDEKNFRDIIAHIETYFCTFIENSTEKGRILAYVIATCQGTLSALTINLQWT